MNIDTLIAELRRQVRHDVEYYEKLLAMEPVYEHLRSARLEEEHSYNPAVSRLMRLFAASTGLGSRVGIGQAARTLRGLGRETMRADTAFDALETILRDYAEAFVQLAEWTAADCLMVLAELTREEQQVLIPILPYGIDYELSLARTLVIDRDDADGRELELFHKGLKNVLRTKPTELPRWLQSAQDRYRKAQHTDCGTPCCATC